MRQRISSFDAGVYREEEWGDSPRSFDDYEDIAINAEAIPEGVTLEFKI